MGSKTEFENADYSNFNAKIYDISGNIKKTYENVVSVMSDYILVLENDNLVMYDVNGNSTIVEKSVAKDYIYNPNMYKSFDKKDAIEIQRQKKSSYDGMSNGEIVYFEINK